LAVRSGGHSPVGHSVVDNGLVIDMRDMRSLEFDLKNNIAWAGSGLTAGEVVNAAAEHGLAIGFGDTASVGIGGITLGGGMGYLSRKYGLTIDNLLAAEVVTADGRVLMVDKDTHSDLFWALRGGGGNFGVVTRFQYQLHALDTFLGGMLFLPATTETIAGFIAAADAAPDELSTIANVMPAPPMPFLPAELHGKLIIMAMMACLGPMDAAEKIIAPFRALAAPLADMVRPIRYPELFPPDPADYHPATVVRGMFVNQIDLAAAQTITEYLQTSNAPLRVTQLRVLGGAVERVSADDTAYAHRKSRIMVNLVSVYDGPEDRVRKETWANDFAAALNQGDFGAYVNFLGDEGESRIRDAYPGTTWERLAAVKARYDPENLLRLNQNIPPGGKIQ
jgi:hypothetical protein